MNTFWPIGTGQANKLDRHYILMELKNLQANKMLDTGVGSCNFTVKMAEAAGATEVHGIDIQDFNNACANKNIQMVFQDLNKPLLYPNDAFDLVTSIQNIEHLTDTDSYLSEIYRVLKPGKPLVLHTVNLAAIHYRLLLLFGFMPNCLAPSRIKIHPWRGDHGAYPHKSVFTYKALITVLRHHGFEIVRGRTHTIYPLPTVISNIICALWSNSGLFISIIVRKPISK
jgi:2-polyprenyl-3-methyl-5-hydroxy-6-metoxy-1,4-benzoquinol methylase